MSEKQQMQPDYYYLPTTCPSRDGVHAALRETCGLCGWEPPSGLVGLDQLMELGAAPYVPKHRRSLFRDRLRSGRRRGEGLR